MFHRVATQLGPVNLYTSNNPVRAHTDDLLEQHKKYGFIWVHLTGYIRQRHLEEGYIKFVSYLRELLVPPELAFYE